MIREYSSIREVAGPLMLVDGVFGAQCAELVEVRRHNGGTCFGRVIELNLDRALIALLGGAEGIDTREARVRFLGRGMQLAVSQEMIGRVFDGLGQPRDGGPAIIAEKWPGINGAPSDFAAREYPDAVVHTGISAIDGLNAFARGQNIAIFSGCGLEHNQLVEQIVRQAKAGGEEFCVVFGAVGLPFEEANYFVEAFEKSGVIERAVLYINRADDPVMARVATPHVAMTAAEYLAFEKDRHVLVVLVDMTNYAEALRELSAARHEAAGRRGYPNLHADFAAVFERAGRIRGKNGSITQISVLTMPEDDITHPIPDAAGYAADGHIILSRALHNRGMRPPIDVLASRNRLKLDATGDNKTREDHRAVMELLTAAYVREESAIAKFEKFISQRYDEARTIEETLDLGREILGRTLPNQDEP